MNEHWYAMRNMRFSLHMRNLIVSCSYDMMDALVSRYDHHIEFVTSVDMILIIYTRWNRYSHQICA
ncbi:hypothetical protein HN51_046906 [Arachis hypogaea]